MILCYFGVQTSHVLFLYLIEPTFTYAFFLHLLSDYNDKNKSQKTSQNVNPLGYTNKPYTHKS